MSFSSFKLSTQLIKALHKQNFTIPTAIQEKVIPLVLDSCDIMAKAKTGSGKSASYILPLLELWLQNRGEGKARIKTLILTPTRELTLQVASMIKDFGMFIDIQPKVVSIIGGQSIGEQLYKIQQGCDFLVATSGRFLDILNKKQMNLSHIEHFVLDEADKMLNIGFAEELQQILEVIPNKRQNLLFSATYPSKVLSIISKITNDAKEVSVDDAKEVPTVKSVTQRAIEVNQNNRGPLLRELFKIDKLGQTIVFMANKRATDNIAQKFRNYGFKAESFHGDLEQVDRTYTLDAFKSKKINILFATDIAARGLDIKNVESVVNFDLPRSPTDYIHRIGRTARAEKTGTAISFIHHENSAFFKIIEKKCKVQIKREQIKGFELEGKAPITEKGKAPVKGKKKSKKDKLREKLKDNLE